MKNLKIKKFFKNSVLIFFIFFIFLTCSFKTFAINESRANRLFNLEYRSFFIGTIIDDSNEKFKIKIDRVFIGDKISTIEVDKFYKYSYSVLIPQKKDHIVAVLNRDNKLDLTWIFKATSTNYKTLYLANDLDENNEDVKLFQKFINDGEYILNLEEGKLNFKDKNNTKEKNNNEKLKDINKKADKEFEDKMNSIYSLLKNPILFIFSVILFLVIFYCLRSRKKFREEVEKDEKKDFM